MSERIPEGWVIEPIGERIAVLTDYTANGSFASLKENVTYYNTPSYSALVRTTDLEKREFKPERFTDKQGHEFLKKSELFPGDIVIANVGSAGKAYRVPRHYRPMTLAPNMYLVKFSSGMDEDFAFQVIISESFQNRLLESCANTTLKAINKSSFRGIEVAVPPLPEQQKIATILSSVDDVIEKTRVQIDKLKDLKTGMMQELLTKGIGHTEFKDSPVGKIPLGWDVCTVSDIAKLTSGGTPDRQRSEYWNGSVPWVKTGEVNYQTIYDTDEKITALGLEESSAKLVPAGAVLMAMYGQGVTRGKVAKLGVAAAVNQACLAMIPNSRVLNDFLYYFFSREYFSLRSMVQEGAQKNLSMGIVKEIFLPVPPREEQKLIVSALQSVDIKIQLMVDRLNCTLKVKKALMQDLLTGKVRVNLTDKESAVV